MLSVLPGVLITMHSLLLHHLCKYTETSLLNQLNKNDAHENGRLFFFFGGEDGIRTHARLASPSSFRNCPLQPLGYFSSGGYYIIET